MKLTEEQKQRLESCIYEDGKTNSESFHEEFDEIMRDRLSELDPEFVENLEKIAKEMNADFWYA